MLLHQLELTREDLTQVQAAMEQLVRKQHSPSVWKKWRDRVWKKVSPGYTIQHWIYRKLPKDLRNRFLVLAYKYLDCIPGATYRAPASFFEEREACWVTRVNSPTEVRIETYLPMHRDNQFLHDEVVTILFFIHKTLQGCNVRVRLPGDCARVLPVHEGMVLVLHGEVNYGVTTGLGPGVYESVAMHLPERSTCP